MKIKPILEKNRCYNFCYIFAESIRNDGHKNKLKQNKNYITHDGGRTHCPWFIRQATLSIAPVRLYVKQIISDDKSLIKVMLSKHGMLGNHEI